MEIKAQAFTDFVAEFTYEAAPESDMIPPEIQAPEKQNPDEDFARWKLFVDGSSNQ